MEPWVGETFAVRDGGCGATFFGLAWNRCCARCSRCELTIRTSRWSVLWSGGRRAVEREGIVDTDLHIRLLRARLFILRHLSVFDLRSPYSSMCSPGSVSRFSTSFVSTIGTQIHLSPCLECMQCSSPQLYFALARDWSAASIMKSSLRGARLRLRCTLKTISLQAAEFWGAYFSRSACSTDGFSCMDISVVVLLIMIAANLGSLTLSTRECLRKTPNHPSLHDISLHAKYWKDHSPAIHHKARLCTCGSRVEIQTTAGAKTGS